MSPGGPASIFSSICQSVRLRGAFMIDCSTRPGSFSPCASAAGAGPRGRPIEARGEGAVTPPNDGGEGQFVRRAPSTVFFFEALSEGTRSLLLLSFLISKDDRSQLVLVIGQGYQMGCISFWREPWKVKQNKWVERRQIVSAVVFYKKLVVAFLFAIVTPS